MYMGMIKMSTTNDEKEIVGRKRFITKDGEVLKEWGSEISLDSVIRSRGQLARRNPKYKEGNLQVFDGAYNLTRPNQWATRIHFYFEGRDF